MSTKTIRNKDVLNSLPLLASILGRNYNVHVEIGGNSAYTDGSTIHIPSLPLDCDTELLHLARGYLDHEAAHIRHTDFKVLHDAHLDAVTKHIWNSIEDWRVEDKLSSIYPGCRQHFQWLARKVFLEDADKKQQEAGAHKAHPASSVLEYVLLTVRSWAAPELSVCRERIATDLDTNFVGLRSQLESILTDIQISCQNTQDAISFAQKIAATMKQWTAEAKRDASFQRKQVESAESTRPAHQSKTNENHVGSGDATKIAKKSLAKKEEHKTTNEPSIPPRRMRIPTHSQHKPYLTDSTIVGST